MNKIEIDPLVCTHKLPAGIYITLIPTEGASTLEPEVYIRMAMFTADGQRMPVEMGHRLRGEAFAEFVAAFQVMDQPLLQWLIDHGYESGRVIPL